MNKSILLTAVVMLAAGVGIGYWVVPKVSQLSEIRETAQDEASPKRKVLFYRNAMNPAVTSPTAKKDSMGMDYVPVYAESETSTDKTGTVKIDPVMVQNIGVRTAKAKRDSLSRTIRAVGRVDFDEERIARLHPKVEGWIEKLFVDRTGESVRSGDMLVSIYSPKLVSTEQEHLLALNNLKVLKESPFDDIRKGAEALVKSSRQRLRLLDVPEHQIKELEKSGEIKRELHIHTTVDGTVIRIGSRKGQYVTPKTELFMVVDLSKVWVYAEVYDNELPWIRIGDKVDMTLASVPGKTFKGTLNYIYPYVESKTRTTKVRVVFDNKEMLLRPNMFAEVVIRSDTRQDVIIIPSEAVIRSGSETQVFIIKSPGKYEPRKVRLGNESQGEVIVLAGLKEGEEVVTSAQFLIDSESKLREATHKMMSVPKSRDRQGNDTSDKKMKAGMSKQDKKDFK